jgi:hypothetical protein
MCFSSAFSTNFSIYAANLAKILTLIKLFSEMLNFSEIYFFQIIFFYWKEKHEYLKVSI